MVSVTICFKNKQANSAPSGSANADINVYFMASSLFLLPEYMGTDILIPSGILCKAMAMVRVIPNAILLWADKNVAIPSGIL